MNHLDLLGQTSRRLVAQAEKDKSGVGVVMPCFKEEKPSLSKMHEINKKTRESLEKMGRITWVD